MPQSEDAVSFVVRAVFSARKQTFQSLDCRECLLAHGGNADETAELADEFPIRADDAVKDGLEETDGVGVHRKNVVHVLFFCLGVIKCEHKSGPDMVSKFLQSRESGSEQEGLLLGLSRGGMFIWSGRRTTRARCCDLLALGLGPRDGRRLRRRKLRRSKAHFFADFLLVPGFLSLSDCFLELGLVADHVVVSERKADWRGWDGRVIEKLVQFVFTLQIGFDLFAQRTGTNSAVEVGQEAFHDEEWSHANLCRAQAGVGKCSRKQDCCCVRTGATPTRGASE